MPPGDGLADEVGVSDVTIYRWLNADRYPENVKAVMIVLDSLTRRKRIPKKRRYKPGSRTRKDS